MLVVSSCLLGHCVGTNHPRQGWIKQKRVVALLEMLKTMGATLMKIILKTVKKLSTGGLGRTRALGRDTVVIEVSEKDNQDLWTFGVTVFHELLHVWTNIMKTNGAELDMRKEHQFIYAMHNPLAQHVLKMRRKSYAQPKYKSQRRAKRSVGVPG